MFKYEHNIIKINENNLNYILFPNMRSVLFN
jgi:hypothetical protein